MSKETVRGFFKVAENDEVLQEKLKAGNSSTSIIQMANERGYQFTTEELQVFMQEVTAADAELSEDELEAVAGGLKIKIHIVVE
ncbi:Nif11-like leader peptide family RiPP precursor [Desmonostoc muscorum LEGE 12446]|uniref:Nif11-like leader peptide family RiPP n=1 Tax=Desmonostoc muscorum LEGE 12446 TaxID=1828758 RepID=A0A8J7AAA3_DESMC|nr:Nif11-like leader peptide family RiPP precursor [Desmonostoc muscorum]MCF2147142.1 Nif11-like leader peptide family RiPP precursor [Desmonostoc muscorum LEGE 12446]